MLKYYIINTVTNKSPTSFLRINSVVPSFWRMKISSHLYLQFKKWQRFDILWTHSLIIFKGVNYRRMDMLKRIMYDWTPPQVILLFFIIIHCPVPCQHFMMWCSLVHWSDLCYYNGISETVHFINKKRLFCSQFQRVKGLVPGLIELWWIYTYRHIKAESSVCAPTRTQVCKHLYHCYNLHWYLGISLNFLWS